MGIPWIERNVKNVCGWSMICYAPFLDASRYMGGEGASVMDKKQIKSALHNYHWMIQVIKLKKQELEQVAGNHVVAQYGVQASLPKPQGNPADPVYFEVLRRDKERKTIEKLEKKVRFIQERMHVITDEKELTVLNRILDGWSLRYISHQFGIPLTNVRRIRDDIVHKMLSASGASGAFGANGADQPDLHQKKSVG